MIITTIRTKAFNDTYDLLAKTNVEIFKLILKRDLFDKSEIYMQVYEDICDAD